MPMLGGWLCYTPAVLKSSKFVIWMAAALVGLAAVPVHAQHTLRRRHRR